LPYTTRFRSPRGAAAGTVELKRRATGEKQELSLADALAKIL
jgi:prolyl-tRNA synthetase